MKDYNNQSSRLTGKYIDAFLDHSPLTLHIFRVLMMRWESKQEHAPGTVLDCSCAILVRTIQWKRGFSWLRHVEDSLPCALSSTTLGVAVAMQVTSTGPQTIQVAQGEKATLECMYTPGPGDIGELDIEWSLVSPDMTQKDNLVSAWLEEALPFHAWGVQALHQPD